MALLIDVREPLEFRTSHAPGAINIPLSSMMLALPDQLLNSAKDRPIRLYCASGTRSQAAIEILKSHGFSNLINSVNQQQAERMSQAGGWY